MARITKPVRFSEHFEIPSECFDDQGVLNPILNMDVRLFISPLLLQCSSSQEMKQARRRYEKHFGDVLSLLANSRKQNDNDVAWRAARRLLMFPEVKGIGLGYSTNSRSGVGSGVEITETLLHTAYKIVELGLKDKDLFVLLSLLEDGFGADRISDMTANIILPDIVDFTQNFLAQFEINLRPFTLRNTSQELECNLPANPFDGYPVLFLPKDILRKLPIANDWSEVSDAARQNAILRNATNIDIGNMFKQTRTGKAIRKHFVLSNIRNATIMMDIIKSIDLQSYDFTSDAGGEAGWVNLIEKFPEDYILPLVNPQPRTVESLKSIVKKIIERFKFLITDRRLSEELFSNGRPKHERSAQRLFFAVAYSHCKANNLDITPEADTGNGPVDFKFSVGLETKILVEIKLSTNSRLVSGYGKQLEKYKAAEETSVGFYIVIDVGGMGNKFDNLMETHNLRIENGKPTSEIELIDGQRKPSASNL